MTTHEALDALRVAELTEAEVRAVLARHARRRRPGLTAPALAVAAALVVAVAVPPTRAAIEDALRGALAGGELPGATVPARDLPAWLRQLRFADGGQPRTIAEAEGQQLLVFRQTSGALCFDFGGVGICDSTEEELFALAPVALFGPTGPDRSGRFRLWGLALATVDEVQIAFASAPPARVPVAGAFGIALPDDSAPRLLRALDGDGRVVATFELEERWQRRPGL